MISYKFSDTLLVTLTTSQMITNLSALKQLFYLGQYFVDQRCRKGLSGRFSIGVSQEVAVRCGLGSTEGSTGLAIQDVPLTRPAVATGCCWALSWGQPECQHMAPPTRQYYTAATSPRVSFPRKTGRSCMAFSEQASEVPQCCFHCNLLLRS